MSRISVMIAMGTHLLPFRTEKLNPSAPKILDSMSGKIGHRRGSVLLPTTPALTCVRLGGLMVIAGILLIMNKKLENVDFNFGYF